MLRPLDRIQIAEIPTTSTTIMIIIYLIRCFQLLVQVLNYYPWSHFHIYSQLHITALKEKNKNVRNLQLEKRILENVKDVSMNSEYYWHQMWSEIDSYF